MSAAASGSGGLKGQVAVVSGASSGIGRAIALALAAEGTSLCLVGRRENALGEVAQVAADTAPRVLTYVADLTVDDHVQELARRVDGDWGAIDVIIHSAATFARGPVSRESVTDLDRQYRANLRAPFALTAALLPLLTPNRGQIVFVNSTAGLQATAGVAAYASTKHALRALADALRGEVNPRGVRVLSVFVGRTATPMQAEVHRLEGKAYRPERLLQPGDVAAMVLQALALPRTAEVTEITIRPLLRPEEH